MKRFIKLLSLLLTLLMLTSSIISCANQGLDTFTGESESGNNSGNTSLDANDDNKKDNNDNAADDED